MYRRAHQYRRSAIVAKQQAADATTPSIKQQFEVIAEHWSALAEQVEWMERLLRSATEPQQQQAVLQQQQQQPAHASGDGSTSPTEQPQCPKCGKVMRPVSSSPVAHDSNLDQFRYACDCGEVSERTVARRG